MTCLIGRKNNSDFVVISISGETLTKARKMAVKHAVLFDDFSDYIIGYLINKNLSLTEEEVKKYIDACTA